MTTPSPEKIKKLPRPLYEGNISVEEALAKRRSIRSYQDEMLYQVELSQLLWSALGITQHPDRHTVPSAGGLNPLALYTVIGHVESIRPGVYHYQPLENTLKEILPGDQRRVLHRAALEQDMILQAAAILVISAIYERTTVKCGDRGVQYVHMEVGAAAQNVALQCVSLGLGSVYVGAFRDEEVKAALGLPKDEHPLCLLPVGRIS